jgi:membrane protease YdiL (CAAX protease family)
LYHGVCLLPAVMLGWPLWKDDLKLPNRQQYFQLLLGVVFVCAISVVAYLTIGALVVDRSDVMKVLTQRGYQATWLLPFSLYFIVVNAILEELFWRGVILNELELLNRKVRLAGTVWTAVTFAAWHYLVFRALLRPIWAEVSVLVLLVLAIGASHLYRRTKSLVLPILWHGLAFDFAVIVVFLLVQSD